jgi:hypothetical protein
VQPVFTRKQVGDERKTRENVFGEVGSKGVTVLRGSRKTKVNLARRKEDFKLIRANLKMVGISMRKVRGQYRLFRENRLLSQREIELFLRSTEV